MERETKKPKTHQLSMIEELPRNVQREMMTKLPITDVIHYCESSKTIKENCDDPEFWKHYARSASIDNSKYDDDRQKLVKLYKDLIRTKRDASKYYDVFLMYFLGFLAFDLAVGNLDLKGIKYLMKVSAPNNYAIVLDFLPNNEKVLVVPTIFRWVRTLRIVKSREDMEKYSLILKELKNQININATIIIGQTQTDILNEFVNLSNHLRLSDNMIKFLTSMLDRIFHNGYYPYKNRTAASCNALINTITNEKLKQEIFRIVEKVVKVRDVERQRLFGGKRTKTNTKTNARKRGRKTSKRR